MFGRRCEASQHVCTPKSCARNPRCFYQAMRRRVLAADLVVLNHALFFTLPRKHRRRTRTKGSFRKDFVIFDEAHTIEEVASRHIGMEISQLGLRRALQRLYNPRSKKGLFQAMKNGPGVRGGRRGDSKIGYLLRTGRRPLRLQARPGLSCPGSRSCRCFRAVRRACRLGRNSKNPGGKGR